MSEALVDYLSKLRMKVLTATHNQVPTLLMDARGKISKEEAICEENRLLPLNCNNLDGEVIVKVERSARPDHVFTLFGSELKNLGWTTKLIRSRCELFWTPVNTAVWSTISTKQWFLLLKTFLLSAIFIEVIIADFPSAEWAVQMRQSYDLNDRAMRVNGAVGMELPSDLTKSIPEGRKQ